MGDTSQSDADAGAHKLPDLLAHNLRVVFVGTAASRRAAALVRYYAGPSNRFWRTLHEVGLTPRLIAPAEFRDLLALGIGLTDMSKRGSGMDREVARHDFDPDRFEAAMRRWRPRAVAFTSKKAASVWLRTGTTSAIAYGRRPQSAAEPDFPEVFVLPSPSGASRADQQRQPGAGGKRPRARANGWTRPNALAGRAGEHRHRCGTG